jgi:hypothetical protein
LVVVEELVAAAGGNESGKLLFTISFNLFFPVCVCVCVFSQRTSFCGLLLQNYCTAFFSKTN